MVVGGGGVRSRSRSWSRRELLPMLPARRPRTDCASSWSPVVLRLRCHLPLLPHPLVAGSLGGLPSTWPLFSLEEGEEGATEKRTRAPGALVLLGLCGGVCVCVSVRMCVRVCVCQCV